MIGRLNLVLTILLAAQLSIIAAQTWLGDGPGPAGSRGLLLADLDPAALVRITVETSDEGSAVHVGRETPEADWVVEEASSYPADRAKVDDTLRELAALEIADVVSTSGEHHLDLKVGGDQFDRRLVLEGAGKKTTVVFGAAGRANSVHARKDGEDTVYAVRGYSSWKLSPQADAWIDRTYFQANRQLILTAAIENTRGTLRLERVGQDWFAGGGGDQRQALDNDKVDALLGKVCRIAMSEVAGKKSDFEGVIKKPVASVVLALRAPPEIDELAAGGADGSEPGADAATPPAIAETRVLRIAKKSGEAEKYYLYREGSEFVAEASTWAIKAVLEAEVKELLGGTESEP